MDHFKALEDNDIIILTAIEKLMSLQSRVKIDDIIKKTKFTDSYIRNKIKYFNKIELVETQRIKDQYINVKLWCVSYNIKNHINVKINTDGTILKP